MSSAVKKILVRDLDKQEYEIAWQAMRNFTDARNEDTRDECWLVEHPSVFTQGQAGKAEHLLALQDIPLVQSDRGGQVTYHGPGQIVIYPLLDLRRHNLGVRSLVTLIEESVVELLAQYSLIAAPRTDAPGVYIGDAKIASLGLRVRRGCSYHGVAINVDMDLRPFEQINPCGLPGMVMTQLSELMQEHDIPDATSVGRQFLQVFSAKLGASLVES